MKCASYWEAERLGIAIVVVDMQIPEDLLLPLILLQIMHKVIQKAMGIVAEVEVPQQMVLDLNVVIGK
ncbi:hypothetical protein FACS189421_07150 [Bacteroidia bacterium]|nr:hypothetical protein FACS189421_07150 [Bacteroidia bacterium]